MVEPEADGSGVAVELGVAASLALDEAGQEVADGGVVEEHEESPELGGVPPVLEGVEVALGGAGTGSLAASLAGGCLALRVSFLCLSSMGGGDHRGSPLREGAQPFAPTGPS